MAKVETWFKMIGASLLSGVLFMPAYLVFSLIFGSLISSLPTIIEGVSFGDVFGLIPYVGDIVDIVGFIKTYQNNFLGGLFQYVWFFGIFICIVGCILLVMIIPDIIKYWKGEREIISTIKEWTSITLFCLPLLASPYLCYKYLNSRVEEYFLSYDVNLDVVLCLLLFNLACSALIYKAMLESIDDETNKNEEASSPSEDASNNKEDI